MSEARPVLPAQSGITADQNRKVWHSVKTLGWSREQLHQVVQTLTGKTSLRALTREEAARLIDELVKAGAEPTHAPRPKRERPVPLGENVVQLATQGQIDMICRLLWHCGWKPGHPDFLEWLRRCTGKETVKTKQEAQRAINLLRTRMRDLGIEDQVAESHRRHYPPAPGRGPEGPGPEPGDGLEGVGGR